MTTLRNQLGVVSEVLASRLWGSAGVGSFRSERELGYDGRVPTSLFATYAREALRRLESRASPQPTPPSARSHRLTAFGRRAAEQRAKRGARRDGRGGLQPMSRKGKFCCSTRSLSSLIAFCPILHRQFPSTSCFRTQTRMRLLIGPSR